MQTILIQTAIREKLDPLDLCHPILEIFVCDMPLALLMLNRQPPVLLYTLCQAYFGLLTSSLLRRI